MSAKRTWMRPFSIKNDTDFILPSRGLKLIGVRFYPYDGDNREDERKLIVFRNPCMAVPNGSISTKDLE